MSEGACMFAQLINLFCVMNIYTFIHDVCLNMYICKHVESA